MKEGDVLITKDSESWDDIAIACYISMDLENVLCGYHLAQIRPKTDKLFGKYLFRSISATRLREQFWVSANGITRYGLSKSSIKDSLFPLPPLPEQQQIADFLDKETTRIDTLIAKKERFIELLQEKRIALISHVVTKGLNPDAPMKDSGIEWLGMIPEHWEVTKLKYGYETCLGKMLQPQPVSSLDTLEPYLRAANISWEGVDISDIKKMWFSPNEKETYKFKNNDLLISEGGDVGRATFWKKELPNCYIQNAVHRVRSKTNYSNKILYYWLFFLKNIGYIDLICSKATIAHFTAEKVKETPILSIPFHEVEFIINFLDKETTRIDTLINKTKQSIEKLKEYRTALISAAVTGKVDVTHE